MHKILVDTYVYVSTDKYLQYWLKDISLWQKTQNFSITRNLEFSWEVWKANLWNYSLGFFKNLIGPSLGVIFNNQCRIIPSFLIPSFLPPVLPISFFLLLLPFSLPLLSDIYSFESLLFLLLWLYKSSVFTLAKAYLLKVCLSFICSYLLANILGLFNWNHLISLSGDGKLTCERQTLEDPLFSNPSGEYKLGRIDKH